MLSLLSHLNHCSCALLSGSNETGVIETQIKDLNYTPGEFNDSIGIQNAIVRQDKIVLRSTIDDNAMIRWETPVTSDNWSFTFEFNELNLDSRESAGLYFFYTKEKQRLGNFKGGTSKYHGFMTGIEFQGKSVELVYAKNKGDDYGGIGEYVTKIDSLNPNRFANIENLTMKVICTKQNFKVELYDKDKIIYDNFRYFTEAELENHKKGYYPSLVAEYKHVSSAKAFEIKGAVLNQREETKDYAVNLIKMEKMIPQIKAKNEILHSSNEVKDLIFNINAVSNFAKTMLGDLPETSITKAQREISKEVESLTNKLTKLIELKTSKRGSTSINLNALNLKLQGLEKQLSEIEYFIEQDKEIQNNKMSIFETILIGVSLIVIAVLGTKEIVRATKKTKTVLLKTK